MNTTTNQQTDIFGAGEAHSVPPHHDPAIVGAIFTREAIDRDHVGESAVGRFGNNAPATVLEVWNKAGEVIHAETFTGENRVKLATAAANALGAIVERNRQAEMFA